MLKTKIHKLGNSKAVVIPKTVIQMLDAKAGDEYELSTSGKRIILKPIKKEKKQGGHEK